MRKEIIKPFYQLLGEHIPYNFKAPASGLKSERGEPMPHFHYQHITEFKNRGDT